MRQAQRWEPTIHYDSLSNQKSFVSGYGKLGDSAVKTVEAGASLIDSDGLLQGQQAVPILRTRLKSFVSGYGKLGDSAVKTVELGQA